MTVKLTEYSHGAGCGCKISPQLLEKILSTNSIENYPKLLVGYSNKDDACAFDIGDGKSVLSTTDFFMPIVDDPFTFGQIAATNAISDIYAMGGTPIMAISIFGWPISKLSPEVASQVIEGGRNICKMANIPLAGGHSIDSPEPIFGLAVTGTMATKDIKQNNGADKNCNIFLTKPIGIGILTTAQKQKKIEEGHIEPAIKAMTTLNKIGAEIASLDSVKCITDVTGFGLLGHMLEVCQASKVGAKIDFDKVPLLPNVEKYRKMGCVPGGAKKNFASYRNHITELNQMQQEILCDAQTSGGLLVFVDKNDTKGFLDICKKHNMDLLPIGKTTSIFDDKKFIEVI